MSALKEFSARFGVLTSIIWAYVGEDLAKFLSCYLDSVDKPSEFAAKRNKYDWQYMAEKCAAAYEPGLLWIRHQPVRVSYLQSLRHAIKRGNIATALHYKEWAAEETDNMENLRYTQSPGYLEEHWPENLGPECLLTVSAVRAGCYAEFDAAGGARGIVDIHEHTIITLELASKNLLPAVPYKPDLAMELAIFYCDLVAIKNLFESVRDTVGITHGHVHDFWEAFEKNGCEDPELCDNTLEMMIDKGIVPVGEDISFTHFYNSDVSFSRCLTLLVRKNVLRPSAVTTELAEHRRRFIVREVQKWCKNVIQNDDIFWREIGLA